VWPSRLSSWRRRLLQREGLVDLDLSLPSFAQPAHFVQHVPFGGIAGCPRRSATQITPAALHCSRTVRRSRGDADELAPFFSVPSRFAPSGLPRVEDGIDVRDPGRPVALGVVDDFIDTDGPSGMRCGARSGAITCAPLTLPAAPSTGRRRRQHCDQHSLADWILSRRTPTAGVPAASPARPLRIGQILRLGISRSRFQRIV